MNNEIIELLKKQHKESLTIQEEQHKKNVTVQEEQTRLLELWTAEDRVNNVRLGLVEGVLKKMLTTGTDLSETCKELLNELRT